MRRIICLSCLIFFVHQYSFSQDADEAAVRAILTAQTRAWNSGNIDQFMAGYWKSDSLMLIGKKAIAYGYDSAVAHYKRGYPDKEAMGTLVFDIKEVKRLSGEYYWVLGKWMLSRKQDNPGGHFTLLFRKIGNTWVIVADHTS